MGFPGSTPTSIVRRDSSIIERGQEMLKNVQGWQLIIVAVLFILLFGAKKLPDSAKSIAKSLKIFKSEMKDESPKEDNGEEPKSNS